MSIREPSIAVSMVVGASADDLFDYLARPANHVTIDGSGMLRGTDDERVLRQVGDVFEMRMHNDQLGDYVVENRVVELEPGRRIAWMPVLRSFTKRGASPPIGVPAYNIWGWEVTPLAGGRTRVTEFFDCSASPDWLRQATDEGEGWRAAIESSLSNLAKAFPA